MFKFLVFGVLLWHELTLGVSCQEDTIPRDGTNNVVPAIPGNEIGKPFDPNGTFINHPKRQPSSVNGPLIIERPAKKNTTKQDLRTYYKKTPGYGAHKLHMVKLKWSKARRICTDEGAHLAIIRSNEEGRLIQSMMREHGITRAWVGFHDQFEEGDWISVLDESLGQIRWDAWADTGGPNPDNANGNENCAEYMRDEKGINDAMCDTENSFFCKKSR